MHALEELGDPVRRRILKVLAEGEHASGEVAEVVGREFRITQAAVSRHPKALRDNGFATVRIDGARRIHVMDADPLQGIDAWLARFRRLWKPKLDALATQLARG